MFHETPKVIFMIKYMIDWARTSSIVPPPVEVQNTIQKYRDEEKELQNGLNTKFTFAEAERSNTFFSSEQDVRVFVCACVCTYVCVYGRVRVYV